MCRVLCVVMTVTTRKERGKRRASDQYDRRVGNNGYLRDRTGACDSDQGWSGPNPG